MLYDSKKGGDLIISFYPGGCGNRYLQYLLGNEWSKNKISYDQTNYTQKFEHRYLLTQPPPGNLEYVLTHSINSKQISQVFPNAPIVFIKTDLKKSLRREWILHGHTRYLQRTSAKNISRLEHYNIIRDSSWPEINDVNMLDALPIDILQEVNQDFNKVNILNNSVGKLEQITNEYVSKIQSAYEAIIWHQNFYQTYPQDFSQASEVIDVETSDTEFARVIRYELGLYSNEIFDTVWSTIYE